MFAALTIAAFSSKYGATVPMSTRFPSYLEYTGYYNVPDMEYNDEATGEIIQYSAFRSTIDVPKLDWPERAAVHAAVKEAIAQAMQQTGKSTRVAQDQASDAVCGENEDRTVRVELNDFALLTASLITDLQRSVLAVHPLWRILFVAESPETVVIVYPKVVRVGSLGAHEPWQAELARVVSEVTSLRDKREGCEWRQNRYWQEHLAEHLAQMGESPWRVIGCFDNYRGDTNFVVIFIMRRDSLPHAWYSLESELPGSVMRDATFVTGVGLPSRRAGDVRNTDQEKFTHTIEQWIVNRAALSKLTLHRHEVGRRSVEVQPFRLDERALVTDRELRERYR
jgi:hypothetical protein